MLTPRPQSGSFMAQEVIKTPNRSHLVWKNGFSLSWSMDGFHRPFFTPWEGTDIFGAVVMDSGVNWFTPRKANRKPLSEPREEGGSGKQKAAAVGMKPTDIPFVLLKKPSNNFKTNVLCVWRRFLHVRVWGEWKSSHLSNRSNFQSPLQDNHRYLPPIPQLRALTWSLLFSKRRCCSLMSSGRFMCCGVSTPCWVVWETMSPYASLLPLAAEPETTCWDFSEIGRSREEWGGDQKSPWFVTKPSWRYRAFTQQRSTDQSAEQIDGLQHQFLVSNPGHAQVLQVLMSDLQ